MQLNLLKPKQSLNKAYLKEKISRSAIDLFKKNFSTFLDHTNSNKGDEEHLKSQIAYFLRDIWFKDIHHINPIGKNDLVIHTGKSTSDPAGVIVEVKSITNRAEMLSADKDNLESAFANSLEALYRIIESVTWVGLKINEKTAEMEWMKKKKQDLGTKELRNYFQRTATIMNDFATRIDPEIPLFIKNFEIGANSISQLINLSEDSYSEDVISAYQSLTLLSDQITGAIDGMMGFLSAVIVLPRVEKELNKSRNNVESKLSNLIDQMNVSYSIVEELKKQFEGKYGF